MLTKFVYLASKRMDAIILCTGYIHHFPFMEDKLKLKTQNRLVPAMLHKGILFKDNHNLMYLGMQDQWYLLIDVAFITS